MINDDSIVKYSINQLKNNFIPFEGCNNWVDYTKFLKNQIKYIREGFQGISDTDLSLIKPEQITIGMRIILDDNLDSNCGNIYTDHAAILGKVIDIKDSNIVLIIDGIGQGFDFTRDPDRLLRWGNSITIDLSKYHLILQLISIPKPDGGPIYYYYNKSTRDSRY